MLKKNLSILAGCVIAAKLFAEAPTKETPLTNTSVSVDEKLSMPGTVVVKVSGDLVVDSDMMRGIDAFCGEKGTENNIILAEDVVLDHAVSFENVVLVGTNQTRGAHGRGSSYSIVTVDGGEVHFGNNVKLSNCKIENLKGTGRSR